MLLVSHLKLAESYTQSRKRNDFCRSKAATREHPLLVVGRYSYPQTRCHIADGQVTGATDWSGASISGKLMSATAAHMPHNPRKFLDNCEGLLTEFNLNPAVTQQPGELLWVVFGE